jgi:hypothetical protein
VEPDPFLIERAGVADPGVAGLLAAVGGSSACDAALAYAEAGVPVFPCVPDGKRPLTRHGLLDASCDGDEVARWWRRWPDANVGLATGAQVEVVDVDRRPAGSGFVALERARTAGLTDGWAGIVRTPSRGVHLYYPTQPGRSQRSWAEPGAHVDFRGTGGYVLVPPSRVVTTDGVRRGYELIAVGRDVRPVDAVALRRLLRPPRSPRAVPSRTPARGVDGQRLAAWLASRGEGNRNHALFWAACRYAEQHLPEDDAHQLLGAAARHAGLPEREVTATIRSAYRTAGPTAVSGPARTAIER